MMKQVNIRIPLRTLALLLGLFLSVGAFAQITVKGHVKDATGEAVIGATIRVVGTQTATVSDFDGNFTLKADQGATISVTFVGYQTANVKAAPNLVVTLKEDAAVLENVVVIGYGRAKKSDLTGSVTAIKPDEKNHGLNVNAQDMIQGKIAGVNITSGDGTPGGGAQIRIRGGSSLNASNDPLIVIDGLAMDNYGVQGLANPLSMVNPNDIESFTVLKDASATAIYGSRASNGVIIITTKKGRSGQKPTFNYNGNVSIANKKKTVDVLDGPGFTEFIKNLYGEGSDAYNELGYLDANGNKQYANTDWQDEIFRTSASTDHNLTMSGGLKNMPYRVSIGYTNNNGIIKSSKFERYTGSFNLSPSLLKDHLKRGLSYDEHLVRICDNRQDAELITPDLFDGDYYPDAFFAVNDDTAIGILYTVKRMGLRVPEDISICGFTNGQRAVACDPMLTTVEQRGQRVGEEAAEILIDKVEGHLPMDSVEKRIVRTRLIIRGTTR